MRFLITLILGIDMDHMPPPPQTYVEFFAPQKKESINPLLLSTGPILFDQIRPEHFFPGVRELLKELEKK